MQEFTGYEYIKIAIANAYGLDKLTWEERIDWVDGIVSRNQNLITYATNAKEPMQFIKAVNALRDAEQSIPTGYIMGLDATASGLQVMAALIGCHKTAANVNLIDTGSREDVYTKVASEMNQICSTDIDRSMIKDPVMCTFYGSKAEPKNLLGEGEELTAFYEILGKELTGAMEVMEDIQSCWQKDALKHEFTLPDGHTASVKVMVPIDKKITVDELNGATFTHRVYVNQAQEFGISLAAHITHSIDAYMVREMYRRAYNQGFEILTVHDCFFASPNHMQKVRENYRDILVDITESNMLENILRQITGNPNLEYVKHTDTLGELIKESEYCLS